MIFKTLIETPSPKVVFIAYSVFPEALEISFILLTMKIAHGLPPETYLMHMIEFNICTKKHIL